MPSSAQYSPISQWQGLGVFTLTGAATTPSLLCHV
jgi:hypothetical protein